MRRSDKGEGGATVGGAVGERVGEGGGGAPRDVQARLGTRARAMTRGVRAAGRRELLRAQASRAAEQARADDLRRSLRDEAEAGGAAARRAAAAEHGIDWLGAELAEAHPPPPPLVLSGHAASLTPY